MLRQLPLSLALKQPVDFSGFLPGRNRETVDALERLTEDDSHRFIYLWGGHGVGKTHLLQASCEQASRLGQTPAYLPLAQARDFTPRILEDLEWMQLICLDDIQDICSDSGWELALFNLFNQVRDAGGRLVIAGDRASAQLPIQLADLKSRLGWGAGYQIHALDDDDRLQYLIRAGQKRGLSVNRETAAYLLRRCPRDMHFLEQLLEHLDRYSLAVQRRITIPLVKEALADMPAVGEN